MKVKDSEEEGEEEDEDDLDDNQHMFLHVSDAIRVTIVRDVLTNT